MPAIIDSRMDLQVLTLTGPSRRLEACLGLLSPWCRGIRDRTDERVTGNGQLEFFIPGDSRREVETTLSRWRAADLPALEGVVAHWSQVPIEDWRIDWRGHFSAVRVTEEIVIVPEWDRVTTAPVLIRICPGMAFGTGHHASTRLVIQALTRYGCRGRRVLDMGSGSGMLAIAAAFLGAARVVAVEHDLECEENFAANLELNGLTDAIPFISGDALAWDDFDFDLIVANINRRIVFPFMARYAESDSQATLILSGLLKEEEAQLREHSRDLGLCITNMSYEDEWLCAEVISSATRS